MSVQTSSTCEPVFSTPEPRVFRNYVGGELLSGSEIKSVENPATEEICGQYSAYTAEILDQALESAAAAFRTWSATPLIERIGWMKKLAAEVERHREEVVSLLVAETGKPRKNAEGDFGSIARCLNYFSDEVLRIRGEIIPDPKGEYHHQIVRQPLGVVVGYLAWNFPLLNVGYKIGPVLAAGCTCILKPSSTTPLATALIGEILHGMSFPAGVINIVLGEDRQLADRLVQSDVPAMVTMIGSTESGCKLIQTSATTIKHYSLELGGNAPVIVCPDFDPQLAAQRVVRFKMHNSGQVCVVPNRCFVHEKIYDAFVEAAIAEMKQYHFGADREAPDPSMGPITSKSHFNGLLKKIERAKAQGARILYGGATVDKSLKPRGYYLMPTLVACDRAIELCVEEIFGPILPVIRYSDADDIVAWANDSRYGLAAYIFTNDLNKANAYAERLEYGSTSINQPCFSLELPHGGLKQSGIGKDCSHFSLEEYFSVKRVSMLKG